MPRGLAGWGLTVFGFRLSVFGKLKKYDSYDYNVPGFLKASPSLVPKQELGNALGRKAPAFQILTGLRSRQEGLRQAALTA